MINTVNNMKRVTFNENMNTIHHIVAWNFAHRHARNVYWEYVAIDRMRFQRRIRESANIIDQILDVTHRQKIKSQPKYLYLDKVVDINRCQHI